MTEARKEELNRLALTLLALERGPIRCMGGVIWDCSMKALFGQQYAHQVIRDAFKFGFKIERIDAGGSPTWMLVEILI